MAMVYVPILAVDQGVTCVRQPGLNPARELTHRIVSIGFHQRGDAVIEGNSRRNGGHSGRTGRYH